MLCFPCSLVANSFKARFFLNVWDLGVYADMRIYAFDSVTLSTVLTVNQWGCCCFQIWQTAAQEKEGQQSELSDKIQEMERQAGEQRQQLQEKITMLEGKLADKDSSSGDLLQQISKLEQTVNEKDQAASDLDLKVKNYERQLERLNEQLSERTIEYEDLRKRANAQEKEYEARIGELEKAVKTGENTIEEVTTERDNNKDMCARREKEIEELNKKFGQLKEEAKSRIKELKALGEQRDTEHKEHLARNEEAMERLKMEFQFEREQLLLDHQAEMKVSVGQLFGHKDLVYLISKCGVCSTRQARWTKFKHPSQKVDPDFTQR